MLHEKIALFQKCLPNSMVKVLSPTYPEILGILRPDLVHTTWLLCGSGEAAEGGVCGSTITTECLVGLEAAFRRVVHTRVEDEEHDGEDAQVGQHREGVPVMAWKRMSEAVN